MLKNGSNIFPYGFTKPTRFRWDKNSSRFIENLKKIAEFSAASEAAENNNKCGVDISVKQDISLGLTRRFGMMLSTYLCTHSRKWLLSIKLIWSKCSGINCVLFPNAVATGYGISND